MPWRLNEQAGCTADARGGLGLTRRFAREVVHLGHEKGWSGSEIAAWTRQGAAHAAGIVPTETAVLAHALESAACGPD